MFGYMHSSVNLLTPHSSTLQLSIIGRPQRGISVPHENPRTPATAPQSHTCFLS